MLFGIHGIQAGARHQRRHQSCSISAMLCSSILDVRQARRGEAEGEQGRDLSVLQRWMASQSYLLCSSSKDKQEKQGPLIPSERKEKSLNENRELKIGEKKRKKNKAKKGEGRKYSEWRRDWRKECGGGECTRVSQRLERAERQSAEVFSSHPLNSV